MILYAKGNDWSVQFVPKSLEMFCVLEDIVDE